MTLTVLTMKGNIFWNMTPCSQIEVRRRFEGTYCYHRQDRGVS
jgi:hypothetical protein